jgi:alanine racemase
VRPTWADIDLGAIRHNVLSLRGLVAPAEVCAVVKADAYGHGTVAVARAAIDAGASWLAVALVEEGRRLRDAGISVPILVLSEPRPFEMIEVATYELRPAVYSGAGIAAAAAAATQSGRTIPVHLKVDTGMHRVGAPAELALTLAKAIADRQTLELDGVWTHCAIADIPDDPYTNLQLDRFDAVLAELAANDLRPNWRHAANSATAMAFPRGRYDMVRAGIAVYGVAPGPGVADRLRLRPALTLRSQVSYVKAIAAGERVSYGLRWAAPADGYLATVPIGYADGVRRSLWSAGGEVLIGGQRRPLAGVVTMDQLMVDLGDDDSVHEGDEVILIGRQGSEEITAEEVAAKLDTIGYEVVCDIETRVPRRYH